MHRPAFVAIFIVVTIIIIGSILVVFLLPLIPPEKQGYYINITNSDPHLDLVSVTLPDKSVVSLYPGKTINKVLVLPGETIPANGERKSGGIKYDLTFTFSDILTENVYLTTLGTFTDSTSTKIVINNQYSDSVPLFTRDMNGNSYRFKTIGQGEKETVRVYLNQIISTSSHTKDGVILLTTEVGDVVVDSSKNLNLIGLPSSIISFKNGTNTGGTLKSLSPWNLNSSWESEGYLSPNSISEEKTAYIGQWWRIVGQDGGERTPVTVISDSNLISTKPIVLHS
jgi:hypothetical protein